MFEKLRRIIMDVLYVEEDKVTESTKIIDELGADSIDIIQMLIAVEDEFGVSITDEEAVEVVTVGDFMKILEQRLSEEAK